MTSDNVSYKKGFFFDYVTLSGNFKLRIEDNAIELPSSIQISLLKKIEICLKLDNESKEGRAIRIVSVYSRTGNIRSLTQCLNLSRPMEPEIEAHSTTPHQSFELLAFKDEEEIDKESSLFDFSVKKHRGISTPRPSGSIEEMSIRESIRGSGLLNASFDENETVLLKTDKRQNLVVPSITTVTVPSMTMNRIIEDSGEDSEFEGQSEATIKKVQIDSIKVDVHI